MRTRAADDQGSSVTYSVNQRDEAMNEFAIEAVESLAGEVRTLADRRMEEARRKALEIYYEAEELARDPAHAELVPHVEAMRRAYEAQYGKPIPPRT